MPPNNFLFVFRRRETREATAPLRPQFAGCLQIVEAAPPKNKKEKWVDRRSLLYTGSHSKRFATLLPLDPKWRDSRAKRLECVELAPAFGSRASFESAGKPCFFMDFPGCVENCGPSIFVICL